MNEENKQQPQSINIGNMQQQYQINTPSESQSQSLSPSSTQDSNVSPEFKEFQEEFKKFYLSFFNPDVESLIVKSKKSPQNPISYDIAIKRKGINMQFVKSNKTSKYEYEFNTNELKVNNTQQKDEEKIVKFFKMMRNVSHDVDINKAELLIEKRK